jgi:hypothetical protein
MRFVDFQYTPLPEPREDEQWRRDLVSVLDENLRKLQDSLSGVGQDISRPYIHLTKTVSQDHGGASGTIVYVNWDVQETVKHGFVHDTSTNSSRIYVNNAGRYELKSSVGIDQGGAARTTQMLRYRVNGTTAVVRGTSRSYSRGSTYADMAVALNTELELQAGDYIEVHTEIEGTDGTYVQNTLVNECELILRKIG